MTTFPVSGTAPTQADGAAVNPPWSAGASTLIRVVSNRFQNNTASASGQDAIATHGVTTTGDVQVSFWYNGSDVIGHGGVSLGMFPIANGNGWSVFVGNAVHLRHLAGGILQGNLTNNTRTDNGDVYVEITYKMSTGDFKVYLNGVLTSFVNADTYVATLGDTIQIYVESEDYPTRSNMFWGLFVQDKINVTGGVIDAGYNPQRLEAPGFGSPSSQFAQEQRYILESDTATASNNVAVTVTCAAGATVAATVGHDVVVTPLAVAGAILSATVGHDAIITAQAVAGATVQDTISHDIPITPSVVAGAAITTGISHDLPVTPPVMVGAVLTAGISHDVIVTPVVEVGAFIADTVGHDIPVGPSSVVGVTVQTFSSGNNVAISVTCMAGASVSCAVGHDAILAVSSMVGAALNTAVGHDVATAPTCIAGTSTSTTVGHDIIAAPSVSVGVTCSVTIARSTAIGPTCYAGAIGSAGITVNHAVTIAAMIGVVVQCLATNVAFIPGSPGPVLTWSEPSMAVWSEPGYPTWSEPSTPSGSDI